MTKRVVMTSPEFRMPVLLTSQEVAQMLRVDRSTLSRWRTQGTGPRVVYLSPGSPRYLEKDVTAWLERVSG